MSRNEQQKRYILPTELIFQGGLRAPGGCQLPTAWSSCGAHSDSTGQSSKPTPIFRDGFCYNNLSDTLYYEHRVARMTKDQPQNSLAFDDAVLTADGCSFHPSLDGLLYSFRSSSEENSVTVQRDLEQKPSREIFRTVENRYGQCFAPGVERVLNAKGYSSETLLFSIFPSVSPTMVENMLKTTWNRVESNDLAKLLSESKMNANITGLRTSYYELPLQENVLPSFVADSSDLCLGSLIERQHDSFQLYISTFFLQHELLYMPPKGYGVLKVRNEEKTKEQWRKAILAFNDTHYSHTGAFYYAPIFLSHFCEIGHSNYI